MADPFSGGIMPQIIQNRQGLQQLEAQRMEMDAMQRQQQTQDEGASLLEQYQASVQSGKPDSNLLYSAVLKSPTAAQNVLNAVGIVDKQQKQQAAGDVVTLMSAIGNPQAFYKATAQRIAAIKARGGDPTDTIEMAKRYQAGDVEGVKNDLMIAGAALANEGLIKPELIGLGKKLDDDTPNSQREFEYYQKLQKENPELAQQFARSRGYIETGREQSQSESQKDWATYQSLKKSDPEAAKEFGQKAGFISKEGRELSAQAQKRLSEFNDAAALSANNVVKYNDLATQFDSADIGGGLLGGSWGEFYKDITGQQDWKTELRKDYAQVRSSEAIRNLPAGAASDADIAMALKPFPSDNATGAQIASFLRGLAKLSAYNEKYNSFKANYISEKGSERGMLEAWKQYAKENEVISPTVQRTLGKEPVRVGGYTIVEVQ